ncbi:PilZ domain-containing protein [Rummeliibacillus sp. JY-2-4R]
MIYNRKESFRLELERAVDVQYKLIVEEADSGQLSNLKDCQMIEISPSGAKIVMTENLQTAHLIQIELNFVLYAKPFSIQGEIKWKRIKNAEEYLYGVELDTDEMTKALIISELKLRRHQEVFEKSK